MEDRGRDAWGASNGEGVVKHIGPIHESYALPAEWERAIVHTRAASHGSAKSVENAHPFAFAKPDGSTLIGIHNGIIRSHTELNKKYDRTFEVDSMHIYQNLASGLGVADLEGYGALAWYESGDLYLCRFGTYDLNVATLQDGSLVFCSLYAPLEKGAKMMGNPVKRKWAIEEYVKYQVGTDPETGDDVVWKVETLPFAAATRQSHLSHISPGGNHSTYHGPIHPLGNGNGTGSFNRRHWDPDKVCMNCHQENVKVGDELICQTCLEDLVREFKVVLVMEETQNAKRGTPTGNNGDTAKLVESGPQTNLEVGQRNTGSDTSGDGEVARTYGSGGPPIGGPACSA